MNITKIRAPRALIGALLVAAISFLAACSGSSVQTTPIPFPGGPSKQLSVSGSVGSPQTLTLAGLDALPQTSVTTNAQTGGGSLGTHTYTGPLLYDVLQASQPSANSAVHNDLLRFGVLVTGSDGYSASVAWGEIDPRFAGKKIVVATQVDGAPLATADGFARLIVTGDVFAGRFVSNVVAIKLEPAIALPPAATLTPTTSFQLSGLVNTPATIGAAQLAVLPQTQVTITSGSTTDTYGGVLLQDLLLSAGLKLNTSIKNDQLTKSVIAIGSDGYTSIESAGEIDPKFGNIKVLVATTKNGAPLASGNGFARIVVPGDLAAGRWVSSISSIQVGQF